MQASFTPEQSSLVELVRSLAHQGLERARRVVEGGDIDPKRSSDVASSLGGLGIPQECGGSGGGLLELALVFFEFGRQLDPDPLLLHILAEQVALSAGFLSSLPANPGHVALAYSEGGRSTWDQWTTRISDDRVRGQKYGVLRGADGGLAIVSGEADSVAIASPMSQKPSPSIDPSRPAVDLAFDSTPLAIGTGARNGLVRVATLVAAELCGVGRGALDVAVDYVKVREQFGRKVGEFQAVAHQLADAYVDLELAWSLTLRAAWAVDQGHEQATRSIHMAKQKAGQAAIFASERALQVHGGIGMTWEASPHLFLRRAIADDQFLGPRQWHRLQVGTESLASPLP